MAEKPKKLVLAIIDSLKPDMLDLTIEEGRAPALEAIRDRGTYIRDCVSTFPSVTPVASAAIATGVGPGEHHIPSMNWFHRGERSATWRCRCCFRPRERSAWSARCSTPSTT